VDTVKVDNTSGILFPVFDEDVGMLYLAGKVNNYYKDIRLTQIITIII
jgi:hypothetical protein